MLTLGGPVPGGEPAGGPVRTGEPAREPADPDPPAGGGGAPAVTVESHSFSDDLALQTFLAELALAGRRLTAIVPVGEGESLFVTVPAARESASCSAFLDRAPPDAGRLQLRLESQPGRLLVGAHRLTADSVALVLCDGR